MNRPELPTTEEGQKAYIAASLGAALKHHVGRPLDPATLQADACAATDRLIAELPKKYITLTVLLEKP